MRGAALVLALAAAGCAHAPRAAGSVVVEAEGRAPSGPEARARALEQAQRAAVEQAAGVELRARTRVERGLAVEQRLVAETRGVVERFEILETREADGWTVVRVRASVAPAARPASADVRVALVPVAGEEDAAGALTRALAAAGFALVGEAESPDVLIAGRGALSAVHEPRLEPMVSRRARLVVEARDPATRALVWTAARDASAVGAGAPAAAAQALESAAAKAAAAAAEEIPEALWRRAR